MMCGVACLVLVAATGCGDEGSDEEGGGSGAGGGFSVAAGVAQLPALDGQGLMVTTADIDAVAEANGLDSPDTLEEAGPEWLAEMSGLGGAAAMLVPPTFVRDSTPEALVDSVGFWWGAADSFASVSAAPEELSIFEGDLGEPEADGGPLLVASEDGAVAVSRSDALLQQWSDDDLTTLDDAPLTAAAEALDDADAISAVLVVLPDGAPTVGIGWIGGDDGDALAAVAYGFDSDDAAAEAEDALEAGFADVGDLVELDGLEVSGSTVTATVRFAQDRVATPYEMLLRADLPMPQ